MHFPQSASATATSGLDQPSCRDRRADVEENAPLTGVARANNISNAASCCYALVGVGSLAVGLGAAFGAAYLVETQVAPDAIDDRVRMAVCAASATFGAYTARVGWTLLSKACGIRDGHRSLSRKLEHPIALVSSAASAGLNIAGRLVFDGSASGKAAANETQSLASGTLIGATGNVTAGVMENETAA